MLPIVALFGQSEKVVLVEHFTQASCPPCATTNPVIFPILEANHDKVAVISYQVSWPGYDPMNEHNSGEVATRVSYYGVRGVPNSCMDGTGPAGSIGLLTQSNIDIAAAQPAPFDLDLQVEPTIDFNGLTIDLGITANTNTSGAYAAHVVVVEERVNFTTPPGSNGEREFHYVMKKMLPTSRGTVLDADWTAGKSTSLNFDYEFENFYNWREAGVVVFIQNNNNKQIVQARYWEPDFEANEGDDVLVRAASVSGQFSEDFDVLCGGTATPKVRVMNSGKTNLTSFEVEYDVNGSASKTYSWSGNLGSFEETEVELPSIDFPVQIIGEMNVNVNQPNGNTDEYPENGELLSEFVIAPNTTTTAKFEIRPVIRPADLSFKIYNSAGDVILEDGPFTSRTTYSYDLNLGENECYEIEIRNNYTSVNGTYKILDEKDLTVLASTIQGQGFHRSEFGTYNSVSNNDLTKVSDWTISPNPVSDRLNLNMEVEKAFEMEVTVTDLLGKVVLSRDLTATVGSQSSTFAVDHLQNGVYLVSLREGSKVSTKKFIKR